MSLMRASVAYLVNLILTSGNTKHTCEYDDCATEHLEGGGVGQRQTNILKRRHDIVADPVRILAKMLVMPILEYFKIIALSE